MTQRSHCLFLRLLFLELIQTAILPRVLPKHRADRRRLSGFEIRFHATHCPAVKQMPRTLDFVMVAQLQISGFESL